MRGWAGILDLWRSERSRGKDSGSPRRSVGERVLGRVPVGSWKSQWETGDEVEKRFKDGRIEER